MITWQEQNAEVWAQVDFGLSQLRASTVVWITCDSYHHIRTLVAKFKAHFPSRQHFEHRITDFKEASIPAYFRNHLPADAYAHDPASAFVHLFGLEMHVGIGNERPSSHFFESLNFEREAVFGDFPFVTVIWSDTSSQIKAQVLAPDFWDWMTEKFHFEAPPIVVEQELAFMQEFKNLVAPEQRDALIYQIARQVHLLERTTLPKDKLSLLESLADNYQALQDYDKAIHYRQEALKLDMLMQPRQLAFNLNGLGIAYYTTGNPDSALNCYEQCLKILQEIGDRTGEGAMLNNISQIHYDRGDYETALNYLNQGLKIYMEIGDRKGEGAALNNISQIHNSRGESDRALAYLEQSLKIRQEIGDLKGEGITLNNISQIHDARGDHDTALHYLAQSLKIQQEIGDIAGMATTLHNLGANLMVQGKQEDAIPFFTQALQIFQKLNSPNAQRSAKYLDDIKAQIGEARYNEIVASLPPFDLPI